MIAKLSVVSPTSQLILQPFRLFTYVTAHSPTLPLPNLRHSSFSNTSFASPTSQDFHLRHRAHSPSFLSFHLRHSSFSNPSVSLPTSQLILQTFFCFSYVTGFSLTLPGEPPMLDRRPRLVRPRQIRPMARPCS